MDRKYIVPRVLQFYGIMLEDDFLQGPSAMSAVQTVGVEKNEYDSSSATWYD